MTDKAEAKDIVIRAGKKLVEKGLIARTWGNVSCRISAEQFVVTPSGRPYEMLTPEEIVIVNIEDCSYEGDVEPSSEKGVHAEVYRQRPDINFVIHTHQSYASAVSPLGTDLEVSDSAAADLLGSKVMSIPYGLPGSKKLKNNVSEVIAHSKEKAYLMVSHGALCLGRNCDQAFKVAACLEQICAEYINKCYLEVSGRETFNPEELRDYYVAIKTEGQAGAGEYKPKRFYCSERSEDGFKLYLNSSDESPFSQGKGKAVYISLEQDLAGSDKKEAETAAALHSAIYRKHEDIGAIFHTLAPDILAVSQTGRPVYPMLDDFAQIIGTSVRSAAPRSAEFTGSAAENIARKMKGRGAVMLKGSGAICCGSTKSDALAAAMIMDKNCKAIIASALFGQGKPINALECMLMRFIYLKRYSKKANL